MRIGNWLVFFAALLLVSMTVGGALALPDQNSPRNITFIGDNMSPSGYGINNASRIAFNDGTSATSWSTFVTNSVLSAYQSLVHSNFTSLFLSVANLNSGVTSVNATAVSAQSTANAALTGVGTVNTTAVSALSVANAAALGVNQTNSTAVTALGLGQAALPASDQRFNETSLVNALSTFAQTKAATGAVTCANGTFLQNVTLTNGSVTAQCAVDFGGSGGGGSDGNNFTTSVSVTGTTTKTVTLNFVTGSLSTTFTDLDSNETSRVNDLVTSNTSAFNAINGVATNVSTINSTLNTRINQVNTTVAALLTSNTSTNARIDAVNSSVQNLITSNTSAFSAINGVQANVTSVNSTLNTRINQVNTSVQNLITSNTTAFTAINGVQTNVTTINSTLNTRIDQLNVSKGNVSAIGSNGVVPVFNSTGGIVNSTIISSAGNVRVVNSGAGSRLILDTNTSGSDFEVFTFMSSTNGAPITDIDLFPVGNNSSTIRIGRNINTTGTHCIEIHGANDTARAVHRLCSRNQGYLDVDGRGLAIGTSAIPAGIELQVAGDANFSSSVSTPQICLNGDCQTAWPSGGGSNVSNTGANATGDYLLQGWGYLPNGTAVAYAIAVPVYGTGPVTTPLNANGSRNFTLVVPTTTGDEVLGWNGSNFTERNVTSGTNINGTPIGPSSIFVTDGTNAIYTSTVESTPGNTQTHVTLNGFNNIVGLRLRRTGTGTSDFLQLQNSSNVSEFVVNQFGRVGIGDTTPEADIDVRSMQIASFVNCNVETNSSGDFICGTDDTGGGGFTYSDYFNQNLNTTNSPTFVEVNTAGLQATSSAGLLVEASTGLDIVDFGSANTNNTAFYGDVSIASGENLCLGGDCRLTWPVGNFTGRGGAGNVAIFNSSGGVGDENGAINVGASTATFYRSFVVAPGGAAGFTFGNGGGNSSQFDIYGNAAGDELRIYGSDASFRLRNFSIGTRELFVNGNLTVASNQKLSSPEICLNGDCRTSWPTSGAVTQKRNITFSTDFMQSSTTTNDPYFGAPVSSGAVQVQTSGHNFAIHPGVLGLRDSTTGGGGYTWAGDAAYRINGNESARIVFGTSNWTNATSQFRFGFDDSATATPPVDGVWLGFNGSDAMSLCGYTRSNSVLSRTSTCYTLVQNTWHVGDIQINEGATSVNYTLWDENMTTILWSNTVTTNIPTASGRELNIRLIATESSTSAAQNILFVDYMDHIIGNQMYRVGRR